jgi:hypothetical protein
MKPILLKRGLKFLSLLHAVDNPATDRDALFVSKGAGIQNVTLTIVSYL